MQILTRSLLWPGPERTAAESSATNVKLPSQRVDAIEGLRGYLALWVLVSHVFWYSGLGYGAQTGALTYLAHGDLAVKIFMIVSGFAIFLCLDTQQGTYKQFVVRRFWRLFPAFIIMFAISIPISWLSMWSANHASQYLTATQAQVIASDIQGWWDNLRWHIPFHISMLHGLIPEEMLPGSPTAFLIPAWSISLEWQFYLMAPVAYALAVTSAPLGRLVLVGLIGLMLWLARYALPTVQFDAMLPYQTGYFALGAASYFAFARRSQFVRLNVSIPIALGLALLLYALFRATWSWALISIAAWIGFLGLILESPQAPLSRLISPMFTNRVSQYLGRISYSIYLSHLLVMAALQFALLSWLPDLSPIGHFSTLLLTTFAATVLISNLMYRFVEIPGIRMGRFASRRINRWRMGNEIPTRS